jgi:hypothetical protein
VGDGFGIAGDGGAKMFRIPFFTRLFFGGDTATAGGVAMTL